MREIKDEDILTLNQKVGELSMALVKGKIKNAQELAKVIEGVLNSEELVFATTMLIIERYTRVAKEYVGMKQKEKTNSEFMYR